MGHNGIIAAASILADTTPPTAPGKPTKGAVCQTTLTISWAASTDNVAVTGYNIYDDGVLHVDAGDVLTYNLTGLTAQSNSNWTVKAYDAASNLSAASPNLNVSQGTNVTSYSSTNNNISHNAACADALDQTYYHDGGGTYPVNNDVIYTTSCGTTKFNGGGSDYYSDAVASYNIGTTGVVSNRQVCTI